MKKYLTFLLLCSLAQAYSYNFRHYTVEQGLSQNTVWCILQDHKGFIWLGTKDGLNRFDGYNFKTYTHDANNPHSIGNNFIRSLYQDDDQKIWVGTDKCLYIFDPATEQFTLFNTQSQDGTRIEQAVNSIVADQTGNIWLGVFGQGLFCYQQETGNLLHFQSDGSPGGLNSNLVWTVHIDPNGIVWAGTLGGGLNRYDSKTNTFIAYKRTGVAIPQLADDIYCIHSDNQNDLWVGTWMGGIGKLDRTTDRFIRVNGQTELLDTHVRSIHDFDKNQLLIGTEKGLFLFDKNKETLSDISELDSPYGLSDKSIYAIFPDMENGYWIGTYFGGVNYLHKNNQIFRHWQHVPCTNSLRGKAISQICEDDAGSLWIATEDMGLNRYNKTTRQFAHYSSTGGDYKIGHDNLHALLYDAGKLWIGTFTKGLDVLDIRTNEVKHYEHDTTDPHSLSDNSVYSIYKDKGGNIYIGTIQGLNMYDPRNDRFIRILSIPTNTYVYDIIQDAHDYLWFATYGTGVFRYNPHTDEWMQFRHDTTDSTSLCHDKVISLLCDSNDRLWLGTEGGGLCEYDYQHNNFHHRKNKSTGLPNDVVYAIVEDDLQNLWLSTNNSLVCYSPSNGSFKKFTFDDGLQSNQFNYKSGFKAQNGELYFGGINGLNVFNPADIQNNKFIPPVAFTRLSVNNEWMEVGSADSVLKKSITYSDELRLSYRQSHLTFNFVSLSFCSQSKNQYAYKLEPADKDWNYIGERNTISFNNIPHGNYTLHIKASNNDNLWNEEGAKIKLVVLPPFWKTIFAKTVYLLLIIGGIIGLITYLSRHAAQKHREALATYKRKKEKEMYESKIAFFTNIAHEIRTPLSLIKAPLETIIKDDSCSKETKENLKIMQLNTERLHTLINQLLDFRKVSEGKFKLQKIPVDLNAWIERTVIRFQQKCDAEHITLQTDLPDPPACDMMDEESMTKVLSNLLTNAIKFTRDTIIVRLSPATEQTPWFEITVSDNGCGVPAEHKEKIFEPFYQINNNHFAKKEGTGIGLAYVKSIVEMHNGQVDIEDNATGGSTFKVRMPHAHPSEEPAAIEPQEKDTLLPTSGNAASTILIAEDNKEMLEYLRKVFSKKYRVFTAENGRMALHALNKLQIDLVISDLVMPETDGMELCRQIKTDIETCHIPVILLTAKTDLETKLESMEIGADLYIEKPFSIDLLTAQVANLFANREKMCRSFISSPDLLVSSIADNEVDEAFLLKLNAYIEENMADVNLSVDMVANAMSLSRSSLHRKVKSLSGLAPYDFIRLTRLKQAARLLTEGTYRISEISYLVGFNTPSYFSKCFYKQFGILPNQFGKRPDNEPSY